MGVLATREGEMTKYWVVDHSLLSNSEYDQAYDTREAVYKAADLHAFLDKLLEELGDTRYTERCRLANVVAMCKAVREG